MKISVDEVRRIAKLARLKFSPEEESNLVVELSGILDYMDKLEQVEIPPDFDPDSVSLPGAPHTLREDNIGQTLDRHDALRQSADADDSYFRVPKVIRQQNKPDGKEKI